MKIAYCLYGQPRDYENGYKNIMNYINSQEIECDFFSTPGIIIMIL